MDEHTERHKQLFQCLDELVSDFINHTGKLPSQTTILELMKWSHSETLGATESSDGPPIEFEE